MNSIYLNKPKRIHLNGTLNSDYTYKLELIKDVEMINENNFRKVMDMERSCAKDPNHYLPQFEESISRVDEYESNQCIFLFFHKLW